MVLSREEHAVNSFSSELSFKAMPGISVQICTEVENRKLPQIIHPNHPTTSRRYIWIIKTSQISPKQHFLLKHELSSLNYTMHIILIWTKFTLKQEIIIFMGCCFFKLQRAFINKTLLSLKTNEMLRKYWEPSRYWGNYLQGKSYIWDGAFCRLKHTSIAVPDGVL